MTPKKKVSPISQQIQEITGGYKPVATPKDATGMQGAGITGTDRNIAKEIEAAKIGYSAEYIASRGGINSQGYFNDVALSGQLNAAEQKSVTLANGTVDTPAMARILQKKAYDEAIGKGEDPQSIINKLKNQWGNLYDSTVGSSKKTGGYDANGNPVAGGSFNADGSPATPGLGGSAPGGISAERRDAFSIIKSTLTTYGFTAAEIAELSTFIESGLTNAKMGPEQLKLDMRELPTYKARFAGNTTRVSAGLNALSEADYLQQENDYSEILKMYGVGNLSSRAQFSSLIGGNISVTEATKRVDAAVKRVKNGDPAVLTTLRTLYPNITDTDIVSYFLKPGEMLPELERKTTVAEIGATAGQFGMKETGLAKFEDLQRYGVTLATARAGYGTIAEELPGATKLGNVYGETGITYGQTEAEAEQFKSSAEAKRKKEKLIETEKSSFKGSAGLNTGGLSTQYLRRSSSAGQF
jgi:hypothetical protein